MEEYTPLVRDEDGLRLRDTGGICVADKSAFRDGGGLRNQHRFRVRDKGGFRYRDMG